MKEEDKQRLREFFRDVVNRRHGLIKLDSVEDADEAVEMLNTAFKKRGFQDGYNRLLASRLNVQSEHNDRRSEINVYTVSSYG